jgi:hypothetical protein
MEKHSKGDGLSTVHNLRIGSEHPPITDPALSALVISRPNFRSKVRQFELKCASSRFPSIIMSTFGTLFRVTTYGESHCASVGAIIDGCPPVCRTFDGAI